MCAFKNSRFLNGSNTSDWAHHILRPELNPLTLTFFQHSNVFFFFLPSHYLISFNHIEFHTEMHHTMKPTLQLFLAVNWNNSILQYACLLYLCNHCCVFASHHVCVHRASQKKNMMINCNWREEYLVIICCTVRYVWVVACHSTQVAAKSERTYQIHMTHSSQKLFKRNNLRDFWTWVSSEMVKDKIIFTNVHSVLSIYLTLYILSLYI